MSTKFGIVVVLGINQIELIYKGFWGLKSDADFRAGVKNLNLGVEIFKCQVQNNLNGVGLWGVWDLI